VVCYPDTLRTYDTLTSHKAIAGLIGGTPSHGGSAPVPCEQTLSDQVRTLAVVLARVADPVTAQQVVGIITGMSGINPG